MKQNNNWRDPLDDLARFVRDVCASKGIDCFLGGETALAAFRDGRLGDFPEFWIAAGDVRRFASAASDAKPDHYEIESVLSEPGLGSFDFSVCDTRTIDFDLNTARRRRHNCLSVRVRPFVRTDDAEKAERKVKKLRARCRWAARKNIAASELLGRLCARAALGRMAALDSKAGGSAVSGSRVVPASCLEGKQALELDQGAFAVPADCGAYLAALFGQDWREREIAPYKEGEEAFRDGEHSWEAYRALVAGIDLDKFAAAKKRYRSYSKEFAKHDREIHRYYRLLGETHKRIMSAQAAAREGGERR